VSAGDACVPISWLRLERYQLGELPPAERDAVAGHLVGCDRCRACLEQIRSLEGADLPALPAGPSPAAAPGTAPAPIAAGRRRRADLTRGGRSARWRLLGLGAASAAAALVLIIARPGDLSAPHRRVIRTKGGDVTFELVRERAGSVAWDASAFSAQDRFKVVLSCPPPLRLYADVAVVQADGTAYPAQPVAISCANQVALPGAFRITGAGPAQVCLSVDQAGPPARDRPPTTCIPLDPTRE
jgi:hypothetical protein